MATGSAIFRAIAVTSRSTAGTDFLNPDVHRELLATPRSGLRDILARFVVWFRGGCLAQSHLPDIGVRHDRTGMVLLPSNEVPASFCAHTGTGEATHHGGEELGSGTLPGAAWKSSLRNRCIGALPKTAGLAGYLS